MGPGDVLEVSIFALERPGEMCSLMRTVSHNGSITLPWVGIIQAGGLSAVHLEDRICAAYDGTYLSEPQVAVNVAEHRSVPVVVTGAVSRPGVYKLTTNRSNVLECLAMAGGLLNSAGQELLIVRGGNRGPLAEPDGPGEGTPPPWRTRAALAAGDSETITVDLAQLIDQGNLLLNLPVRGGDVVIVPPRARRHIYVLGYVRRPGAYELRDETRVDAFRAVALGGGLVPVARPENSYVIRQTTDGQKAMPVDLKKIARGDLPPLYLEAGDTLVVGTSMFGHVSELLVPSMGASISASASVAP
ncbi:MAG: SLBB domain-containing protein [Planctomycetota bacterium]